MDVRRQLSERVVDPATGHKVRVPGGQWVMADVQMKSGDHGLVLLFIPAKDSDLIVHPLGPGVVAMGLSIGEQLQVVDVVGADIVCTLQ